MPRTLKNNDSLLNFFVGREAFSSVWSEGQVVQMGPGEQASQGGPGGQVVRWSEWSGWSAWMICFQKIYGCHALNHQITEKS